MATPRRSQAEQLQLVHECRSSGLTAAEWCRREGIVLDTYYTWIDRLTKRGLLEKPLPIPQRVITKPFAPEIVKVEVEQPTVPVMIKDYPDPPMPVQEERHERQKSGRGGAVMEIDIRGIRIKVTNDINPQLLAETLRLAGGVM